MQSLREYHRKNCGIHSSCGLDGDKPKFVTLDSALELLAKIEPTLEFDEEDEVTPFDWEAARAALRHLSHQHPDPEQHGKVLLWAAKGRQSSRLAGAGSHARFIETPDSEKNEGAMTRKYAINHPILFLLRQDGKKENDWRDTPFYWPIVRAQANTPPVIYTFESID
jgi:hypothetical protein